MALPANRHDSGLGVAALATYAATLCATGALLHYTVERRFLRLRARLGIAARPASAAAPPIVPALDG